MYYNRIVMYYHNPKHYHGYSVQTKNTIKFEFIPDSIMYDVLGL